MLLQQAQNIRTVALSPWLPIPALFVVLTVLCFNFLGDGVLYDTWPDIVAHFGDGALAEALTR